MMGLNNLKKVFWPAILVSLLSIAVIPSLFGYPSAESYSEGREEIAGQVSVSKIVSTLAIRNPDRKVLGKVAEKLSSMNRHDLRLIASLCDRIPADGITTGADIAFSLITAMIVLY